jgi:hypothetical protein
MPNSKRLPIFLGMVILAFASSVTTLALRPASAQTQPPFGTLRVKVQCVPVITNAPWEATLGFAGNRVVNVLRDGDVQNLRNNAGTLCFDVFDQTG